MIEHVDHAQLFHAPVASAWGMGVTRGTVKVLLNHRMDKTIGAGPNRVGRSKDGKDRNIQGCGNMHGTGVVTNKVPGLANYRQKILETCFSGDGHGISP